MNAIMTQTQDLLGPRLLAVRSAVCFLAMTALALGQLSSKDVIWRLDKPGTTSGEIRSFTPDQVTILASGRPERVPVEAISKLRLSDDPKGMASIRASVQSGQLKQAGSQLESMTASGRPITRQEVDYLRALVAARLALRGTGTIRDAARLVASFIKENPTSFRYYSACELMGDLAVGLGKFDSAANYYGKITRSKSNVLSAKGKLLEGNAWLRQGDLTKAARLLKETTSAPDPRLRSMGTIGLAMCVVQEGRPSEAIAQIEKVIQENPSTDVELFARAYNALGQAYATSRQKEAALDSYLHTALLFYRDREAHAEALFHLSKLWTDVNKPGEAQQARQTLQTRYASSPWAKK